MIVETKLAAGGALAGLIVAQIEPNVLGEWTGLGISGVLCAIIFWIVAKRDPEVARINAESTVKAAELHAEASRYVANTLQAAIAAQTQQINAHNSQTHELLAHALQCDVSRRTT